ncbi:MAG: hypothetical protein A3D28_02050 [Omnitrophica bacterium RIFCSPHIGHO2_02_FULL_63_14]|nr:MAG: hypothetical protein A3D28_02050 [Omnitrophica bacterium RIFCSPHIGHO2_02_FULL_63_14]
MPHQENKSLFTGVSAGSLFLSIILLAAGWHKWPDALFDYGYQLYYPWRLASGEVLYKDLITSYGPLSFYVNSLVFRLFGARMDGLVCFNLAIISFLCLLAYRIFSSAAGSRAGQAAAAAFLVFFAFAHYRPVGNYNYVAPYSHEMVHGIFLSFLAFELFMRYLRDGRSGHWAGIGLLLGCAFLTKVEIFLPLFISLSAAHAAAAWRKPEARRKTALNAGLMALAFPLVPLAFLWILSASMPPGRAAEELLRQYAFLADPGMRSLPFYRTVFGIDHFSANLQGMLAAVLVWLAAAALLTLIARRLPKAAIAAGAAAALFIGVNHAAVEKFILIDLFRPLPPAMLALTVYWFYRRQPRLMILALFAFLFLSKMLLFAHLFHVGFVLAMPATLVWVVFLLEEAPRPLRLDPGGASRWRAGVILLFAALACFHGAVSLRWYALKDVRISSREDYLYDYGPAVTTRGVVLRETLEYLNASLERGDTLAVLPEGTMLNYLSRRRNPSRFAYWTPTEERLYGDRLAAQELEASRPDYVLLVDRDASEHGARYFGKDYGKAIYDWVKRDYEAVRSIGEEPFSGRGFGVTVLKRATATAPRPAAAAGN